MQQTINEMDELEEKINNKSVEELEEFIGTLNKMIDNRIKTVDNEGRIKTKLQWGMTNIFLDERKICSIRNMDGQGLVVSREGVYEFVIRGANLIFINSLDYDICTDAQNIKLRRR